MVSLLHWLLRVSGCLPDDVGTTVGRAGPGAEVDGRYDRLYAREVTEFVLTQHEAVEFAGDTPRRFHVELFIVHPTLTPTDISAALGMEAHFAHRVGDRRKTPKEPFSQATMVKRDGDTA